MTSIQQPKLEDERTLISLVNMETKTVEDDVHLLHFLFFHHNDLQNLTTLLSSEDDRKFCLACWCIYSFVPSKLPPITFALFFSLQFSPQTFASATARSLSRSRFRGVSLALPALTGLSL